MQRGKIILRPGSEGAPWDLEYDGAGDELAGATFTLEPAGEGSYRVLISGVDVQAHGLEQNHNQSPLG